MKPFKFPLEQQIKICQMYEKFDESYDSLAKKFNCSKHCIKGMIKRHNIKIKERQLFTLEQEDKICQMYLSRNYDKLELANMFNCSDYKINNILKSRNIKTNGFYTEKQEQEICDMYINSDVTLTELANVFKCSRPKITEFLKSKGIEIVRRYRSIQEKEIHNFLSQYVSNIKCNDRKELDYCELDIYLPENNLAIEHNGLYWHCELKLDNDYHLSKTIKCNKKGIELIHIFENEWRDKKDIVKSLLLSKLGIYENQVDINNCQIVKINKDVAKDFLENNYIKGYIKTDYNIGFLNNGELIYLLGVKDKSIVFYCNKLNTKVNNVDKIILKVFDNINIKHDKTLGNFPFNKLQYTYSEKPSFKYIDIKKDIMYLYDTKLNNNYKKVYDCGFDVYINNLEQKIGEQYEYVRRTS